MFLYLDPSECTGVFLDSTGELMVGEWRRMSHPRYTLIVRPYLCGQYRLQLCDREQPDPYAPEGHGAIVRECCTYRRQVMARTVSELAGADDPVAYLESLARPWNTEFPGDRIRLDSEAPRGAA